MAGCVDIELGVLVKKVRILKVMQVMEHATVYMPINHRDGIAKVTGVCHLAKSGAVRIVFAIFIVIEIKQVVRRALQQGRIDIGARDIEPSVDIGILLNERSEVDGVIRQLVVLRLDLGRGLARRTHLLGTLLLQMVHVEHVAAAANCNQQQHGDNAFENRGTALFARVVHMLAHRLLCHDVPSY